ncbi:cupin-like domain-containing protein [Jeongeupia naejangsanensis]|uniref:Cupin-like domain-containing protein n=1 Tax=Jeongeupia naejangsanensis TaxID=613195 RepID=A0ABS2BHN6_9NEIS|nr:cupin-like domain-containing protein [Jeongeupia naejangsanensis]MBM3115124.1 cupin-like domain-containing protein [Jeongeupia naejangsanensis]
MESLNTVQIDDGWRRWIAENLILGSVPQSLCDVMIAAGIDTEVARSELETAQRSPYIAGAARLKNRLAKHDWILDIQRKLNRQFELKVERHHKLDRERFYREFYSTGRPVIITGMLDDWPAMKKWNLDYFASEFGDAEVQVQFGRNQDAQYEINSVQHRQTMRFGDYVALIRDAGRTNDFYMTANNTSQNRRALSGLWRDLLPLAEYQDAASPDDGFFWLGPAGTITPFHHDLTNNFMAQVIGRKRVLLIPPAEVARVYNHRHCFSEVDGRNIDYNRFPMMRDVQVLECILNPGEILFLPVGCWHFVEGLDVSCTVSSINFRWDNDFTGFYPGQLDY